MNNVKSLIVEPGKKPVQKEIGTSLEDLQAIVGGMIELVPIDDYCHVLCNEEGKIRGLKPNRVWISDILVGTFCIVRTDDEGGFTDLLEDDIVRFSELFETPLTEQECEYYFNILSAFRR